ncbi:MAG: hypothetical protein EU539_08410 [Promethearchaeota archaeon]|nr:MAG: hypothetical protein EU539_08410 [Candidatus Lokiarchaeota archaeon]
MIKILLIPQKKEEFDTSKFIDYDKHDEVFYDNLYIKDFKICIKIPLICKNKRKKDDIKVNKFDLEKYTYLLSY